MLRYRGGEGQFSWWLHRLTGIGIFIYLMLHIVDVFVIAFGPEVFNSLMGIYHAPIMRIPLLLLVAGVLYHAINGLRVILVDFWGQGTRYQSQLFWAEMALFVVLMVPLAMRMLGPLFG